MLAVVIMLNSPESCNVVLPLSKASPEDAALLPIPHAQDFLNVSGETEERFSQEISLVVFDSRNILQVSTLRKIVQPLRKRLLQFLLPPLLQNQPLCFLEM